MLGLRTFILHGQEINSKKRAESETVVPNFVVRINKLGLYCAVNTFQGRLTILLVPALSIN